MGLLEALATVLVRLPLQLFIWWEKKNRMLFILRVTVDIVKNNFPFYTIPGRKLLSFILFYFFFFANLQCEISLTLPCKDLLLQWFMKLWFKLLYLWINFLLTSTEEEKSLLFIAHSFLHFLLCHTPLY